MSKALRKVQALRPVRLLREEDTVKVHYLDTGSEFHLDAARPVQVLNNVTSNDDATVVEVCDPNSLTVSQVDEFGDTRTIVLSPRMAAELARILDSFVFFPAGFQLPHD